ncbi:GNAT family N-acetyltransferase [Aneurinibacillus uraniidurans]|uniref:GNAT family N-acetyltransferase n=1 Tax=Aneurinibacillus uraniidurans TaxID=2966586 RepID=UPI00234B4900|nr:GNAT family N-acetyltransferase [Aneurinibacillus sp. B1]WCN38633.1 GNAT family N-acetyltransferase [Aneurinibacillus sp. B1]
MITRKNVTADDVSFLYQLYKETRGEALVVMDWDEEEREAFLRMQFDMQRSSYALQHLAADHEIIKLDKVPIGQVMTKITDHSIWLIDLSLLAQYRNQGIGTCLIRDLQERGEKMRKAVRLHVLYNNPAQDLYARLGFYITSEKFPYLAMEWLSSEKVERNKNKD